MAQQPERQTETPTPPHIQDNDIFAYEIREQDGRHYAVFTDTFGKLFTYPVVPAQGAQTAQEAAEAADYTVNLYQNDNFISTTWQSDKGQAKVYGWTNLPTFMPVKTGKEPQYGVHYENNGYPKSVGYRADIERMMQRDALQLAEKQAVDAARQPVNDWLAQSGLSAIQAGRARSVLDKRIDYRGYGEMTRADFIRERTAEGWATRRGTDARSGKPTLGIWAPDGSTGYDITETEKRFADWLAQRQQPEQAQPAQETAVDNPAAERQPETPAAPPQPSAPSVDPEWERVVADQRRMNAERIAARAERAPWRDFPPVIRNGSLAELKDAAGYTEAKAGDAKAAYDMVKSLLSTETLANIREMANGREPILISVKAQESSGKNKIPEAMAHAIRASTGWPVDSEIVQINKPGRTGSDSSHRLAFQPIFDGKVEAGRDYLILDDNSTMGGTIASLRGYIENRGGHVIGAAVMSARETALDIVPTQKQLNEIQRKHGDAPNDYWTREFGYGIDRLTRAEAGVIRSAGVFDGIRDRIAATRLQTGVGVDGTTVPRTSVDTAQPQRDRSGTNRPQPEQPDTITPAPTQAAAPDAAAFSMPAENERQAEQEQNMAQQANTPQPERQPETPSRLSSITLAWSEAAEEKNIRFDNFDQLQKWFEKTYRSADYGRWRDGSRNSIDVAYTRDGKAHSFSFTANVSEKAGGFIPVRDHIADHMYSILEKHGIDPESAPNLTRPSKDYLEKRDMQPKPTEAAAPDAAAFSMPAENAKQAEQEQNMAQQANTPQSERQPESPQSETGFEDYARANGFRIEYGYSGAEAVKDLTENGDGSLVRISRTADGFTVSRYEMQGYQESALPSAQYGFGADGRKEAFERADAALGGWKNAADRQPEKPSPLREKAVEALHTAGNVLDAAALAAGYADGNLAGAAAGVAAEKLAERQIEEAAEEMPDGGRQAKNEEPNNPPHPLPEAAGTSYMVPPPEPRTAHEENGIEYAPQTRSPQVAPETAAPPSAEPSPEPAAQSERQPETPENEPSAARTEAQPDTHRQPENHMPDTETAQNWERQAEQEADTPGYTLPVKKPLTGLDYDLPEAVRQRYVRTENGRYLSAENGSTVLFEDQGKRISTTTADPQIVEDMLAVAQAKGWDSIKLTGSREFKSMMYVAAESRGIRTAGYTPTEADKALLARAIEARSRNGIETAPRPEHTVPDTPAAAPASAPPGRSTEDPAADTGWRIAGHGQAPYLHQEGNAQSYYLTLEKDGRMRTEWGAGLPDALARSGAGVGDRIRLHNLGRQPVSVQVPVYGKDGQVIDTRSKETMRKQFAIDVLARGGQHQDPVQTERQPENRPAPSAAASVSSSRQGAEASSDEPRSPAPASEAAAPAAEGRQPENPQTAEPPKLPAPELESARAVYESKAQKLSKSARQLLAFYENNHRDVVRLMQGASLERAMTAFYEDFAGRMKGSKLDAPRPIELVSPEQAAADRSAQAAQSAERGTEREADKGAVLEQDEGIGR